MKRCIALLLIMSRIFTAAAQEAGFKVEGLGSTTLPVTLNKMTNIVFPGAIRSAVKVSRDILAQKVRGVENVIELKAMRRGFPPTNLSVYGIDGHLYSFLLKYVDDTSTLNYRVVLSDGGADVRLAGLPVDEDKLHADAERLAHQRRFLHGISRSGRLSFGINGIWLCDSLQWLVFDLENHSLVDYWPARVQVYVQDVERIARRATQELELHPVYTYTLQDLPGRRSLHLIAAFSPFTIPKGKCLIVQLQGRDGRMLSLRIKAQNLLRVRSA